MGQTAQAIADTLRAFGQAQAVYRETIAGCCSPTDT